MISIPFFEAFVSGSLSALASGTEVAITFALAAIAALIPATCFGTSLFAYTWVTLTPRPFRSFAAWSTPFLNTDQNEPVSPCVTTATLIAPAVSAFAVVPRAKAAAGLSNTPPAASTPPRTSMSRRLRPLVSSSISSSSSIGPSSFSCWLSLVVAGPYAASTPCSTAAATRTGLPSS